MSTKFLPGQNFIANDVDIMLGNIKKCIKSFRMQSNSNAKCVVTRFYFPPTQFIV